LIWCKGTVTTHTTKLDAIACQA